MEYEILGKNNDIAFANTDEQMIKDTQSALDYIMSVKYETGCQKVIINKTCLSDDFFILSTGCAGEILQKFINYQIKAAIIGDYSQYTSKPLKDFIYESNQGNHIYFLTNLQEAVEKLDRCL